MTLELAVAVAALAVSLISLAVALSRKDSAAVEAKVTAKHELGKRYAVLAWAFARVQPDSHHREKLEKHALDAFTLADTAADGTRDFTPSQARVYLDANR